MQKNPEKRLCSGSKDATDIKNHPWFQDVLWSAIIKKAIKAPFIPIIKSEVDVSNFDPEFTIDIMFDSMSNSGSL